MLHTFSSLPLTVRAPISFLKKRINILLDEYLSAAKICANRPKAYLPNSRQKIGTTFAKFFRCIFSKKRGKYTAMSYTYV